MSVYYQDESVTLHHGDFRDVDAWLCADVLVTDPPYGMGYTNHGSRKARAPFGKIQGDKSTDARDDSLSAWGSKPALVFGTWKVERPPGVRLVLTWDKGPSVGTGDITIPWGLTTEEVYVLGEWPRITPGGRAREGGSPARAASVLRVDHYNTQSVDRPEHPTPKPIPLMELLLARCPSGVVADPFAGSGSTLIAAKALGRHAVGVEIDERYCELAANRLAQDVFNFGEDFA